MIDDSMKACEKAMNFKKIINVIFTVGSVDGAAFVWKVDFPRAVDSLELTSENER